MIPMLGHTIREWAAKLRYDALPVAVKTQMAEQGRERLRILRASKQG